MSQHQPSPTTQTPTSKKGTSESTTDFKDALDTAASSSKSTAPRDTKPETYIEKVLPKIPLVGEDLQKLVNGKITQDEAGKRASGEKEGGGPPNRPEHDVQVEEFLRGQYCSKGEGSDGE